MGLNGGATPTLQMKDLVDHTQTCLEKHIRSQRTGLPSNMEQMFSEDFNHMCFGFTGWFEAAASEIM